MLKVTSGILRLKIFSVVLFWLWAKAVFSQLVPNFGVKACLRWLQAWLTQMSDVAYGFVVLAEAYISLINSGAYFT